jgi:hypothetical protein
MTAVCTVARIGIKRRAYKWSVKKPDVEKYIFHSLGSDSMIILK